MNTMNDSKKTIGFVAVAALMAATAVGSHFMNRPTNSADFELVGQPFFAEFDSASQAQSLEVAALDPDSGRLKRFSVENKDGLWRIPSHSDYPAEAAARLATTATSVMGINRDSLAGRMANEHERLGVIDPLGEDIEDPETAGKRITMKDSAGEVVVDYIIGKEAGDVVLSVTDQPFGNNENEKYYFVRRPDEQQTYKVKLSIDLSTKFSDWIDPDLLRIQRSDITKISIDNYKLEEDRSNPLARNKALFKVQGDKVELTRTTSTDTWGLADLNSATEELETGPINSMLGVVDELKIAGVRPKLKYKGHLLLTPDLKLNQRPEFKANPNEFGREISRLQGQLEQKGFSLAGSAQKMALVSTNGDMHVGTSKGVVYTMHIGKAVEGTDDEIEIGTGENDPAGQADTEETDIDSDAAGTDDTGDSAEADEVIDGNASADADQKPKDPVEEAKNRYLMIRVSFDDSLIHPKPEMPIEPVAPVAPESYQPPVDDPAAEAKEVAAKAKDDSAQDPDAPEPPPGTAEKVERNPDFVKHDEALKAYEQQQVDYELAKTQYKNDTDAFAVKVKEGELLVKELNERFGDWYYVITGDNLNTLQTKRTELVKVKEIPASERVAPPRPNLDFPPLPSEDPVKKEPPLPDAAKRLNPESSGIEGEAKSSEAKSGKAKDGDTNVVPEENDAKGKGQEAPDKGTEPENAGSENVPPKSINPEGTAANPLLV